MSLSKHSEKKKKKTLFERFGVIQHQHVIMRNYAPKQALISMRET